MKSSVLDSGCTLPRATYTSIADYITATIKKQDCLIAKSIQDSSDFMSNLTDETYLEAQQTHRDLQAVTSLLGILYDLRRSECQAVQND